MEYFMFMLVPCVLAARTEVLLTGNREVNTSDAALGSTRVLTTTGAQCVFPFRFAGELRHRCVPRRTSSPWCSLTQNFDRDHKWGVCAPEVPQTSVFVHLSRRILDPCQLNPCQNAGRCTPVPDTQTFECSCAESFTGRLCEKTKCYDTGHLRFYEPGATWGRIHHRTVEQCTCEAAGEPRCERARYGACHSNPCENDGTCRRISSTGETVCHCRPGFSGPLCSLEPGTQCYGGNRGRSYRGVVGVSRSGARCLPWDSDLLHNELHVGTVLGAARKGLGAHNYCRNPDGDRAPWCYVLNHGAISWEPCDVPPCTMPVSGRVLSTNHLPGITQIISRRMPKKPSCGRRHKKKVPRGRIIGGDAAMPGTHPWIAAIYIGPSDFCAGTLIASCWVLSAGHCFNRSPLKSTIRVVLGQQNFNVTGPNTRTFGVEKVELPKLFSVFNPTLHDIVLLKLKKEQGACVRKTQFIRPICLPDHATVFPDFYCCSISGWGHEEAERKQYSNLQEAMVHLVPQNVCTRPEVYGNHVTSNMLCAGTGRCVDACQGDSGGPLACTRGDVSFLYGIISWGDGCGQGKPGVYTRVVEYMSWINSTLRRRASPP